MTPKLFKASDVCEMAQLQPYVLRSWEKEFPGIGVQKSPESPRLYRQSDVEQVHRIKELVFGEGLTLSGARKRLEESGASASGATDREVAEVLDALASNARTRIAYVRDGLRSLLQMLSGEPGTVVVVDERRPRTTKNGRHATAGRAKTRTAAKSAVKRTVRKAAGAKRGRRAGA